jgi:hypothetical protein
MALMLLAVLSLGLAVLAVGITARMNEARRESESLRLSAACDAALAEALAGLAITRSHRGDAAHPFAGAVVESAIEWKGLDERRIVVRATRGDRFREAVAEVGFSAEVPYVIRWRRVR